MQHEIRTKKLNIGRALCALFAVYVGLAHAVPTTWIWPSAAAPCNGILQDCIDAAQDQDIVEIRASAEISEDALISRSIVLRGAGTTSTRAAVFAAGRRISIVPPTERANPFRVQVENVELREGYLTVENPAGFTPGSTVLLDRMRIRSVDGQGLGTAGIDLLQYGSGTLDVTVRDSSIQLLPATSATRDALVSLRNDAAGNGPVVLHLLGNRLWAQSVSEPAMAAIDVNLSAATPAAGARSTVRILGNDIRGPGLTSGIRLAGTCDADILSNLIVEQRERTGDGYDAAITLFHDGSGGDTLNANVSNNTVADGGRGLRAVTAQNGAVQVQVRNNVFARLSGRALGRFSVDDTGSVTLTNVHNLLFATDGIDAGLPPGSQLLQADPLFRGVGDYRLQAQSPAIDSGDGSLLTAAATIDAGGGFRIKRGTPDRGAYEFGDEFFRHASSEQNAGAGMPHVSFINHAALNGNPQAHVWAMPEWPAPSVPDPSYLGVYYDNTPQRWSVYYESGLALEPGRLFQAFVLSPPPETAAGALITHTATAGAGGSIGTGLLAHTSAIDHVALNGQTQAKVFLIHRSSRDASVGFNAPLGVAFDEGLGQWRAVNQLGSSFPMPEGTAFSVLSLPSDSPNAFRAMNTAAAQASVRLDHPLLNDNPCATLWVTPLSGAADGGVWVANPHPVGVRYDEAERQWAVFNRDGMPITVNAAFNVYVDAGEAIACLQRAQISLFADGFE